MAAGSAHALRDALNSKDQRTLKRAIRDTAQWLQPDERVLAVLSGQRRLIRNLVVATDRRLLFSGTRWYWFYPATTVREVAYDDIQGVSAGGQNWGCRLVLKADAGSTKVDLYSRARVMPVASLVCEHCGAKLD